MSAWDINPPAPPRRLRGGEIPHPGAASWREQARAERQMRYAQQHPAPPPEDNTNPHAWRIMGLTIDPDMVFAAALVVPMLFMANWGAKGAAVIAALTPFYLFFRRDRLGRVMLKRAVLFAVPAFCFISVVWSQAPAESLKFAVEFLLTVLVGLLISSARNQEAVIRGLCIAFFVYIATAVLAGGRVAIGVGAGGDAFSGLTESKNLLGDIASTGAIVSLATAVMAFRTRKWLWVGFAAVAAVGQLYAVSGARSAGAMLGLGMGVGAFLGLLPLLYVGKAIRAWLTSVLAVTLIVVGLNYRWLSQLIIQTAFDLFDKDPTLTGRTYLWYRAADLIQEKPLLGRGYYAFWLQGNLDAEGLWQYFGITGRGGFTFHNTLVDILVTLGWLGAAVIIGAVLISAVMLIRRFVVRPSMALVFWTAIFLYQVSRTGIETIGIAPFYFSTALAFAALGAAFGRVDSRKFAPQRMPYRPPQTARPVQVWPVEQIPGYTANGRPEPGSRRLRLASSKGG